MGGDSLRLQHCHEPVAHLIIDDAFTNDGTPFQAVKGGSIILVLHDQQLRILGGKYLLGLAFVKLFFLFHNDSSSMIDMVTIPGTIRMRNEKHPGTVRIGCGPCPPIFRWHRSWKGHGLRDLLHCSPPIPYSASRNLRSSVPDRDSTFQRFHGIEAIPL